MRNFCTIAAGALLGFAGLAPAGTVTYTWNFDSPTGNLGTSQAYTSTNDGGLANVTITAYGFRSTDWGLRATDLYGKNGGTGEQGLGIAYTSDNEINPGYFVQLDLTNVLSQLSPLSGTLTIDSVQPGEYYTLYLGSSKWKLGTQVDSGTSTSGHPAVTLSADNPLSDLKTGVDFLGVGAHCGNVLLSSMTVTEDPNAKAPEPATMAMVGGALVGLASLRRRVWKRG